MRRHTWQSWRERYKKNATRLDALIASIVEQKKPIPGEKGQYGYVRQAEERPKRPRKKRTKDQNQKDEDEFNSDTNNYNLDTELSSMPLPSTIPPMLSMSMGPPLSSQDGLPLTAPPNSDPAAAAFQRLIPTSINGSMRTPIYAGPSTRLQPAEEEMEEGDEWAVRVGNDPPPLWGKRKAGENHLEGPSDKRLRSM